jgi:hypothetical protein
VLAVHLNSADFLGSCRCLGLPIDSTQNFSTSFFTSFTPNTLQIFNPSPFSPSIKPLQPTPRKNFIETPFLFKTDNRKLNLSICVSSLLLLHLVASHAIRLKPLISPLAFHLSLLRHLLLDALHLEDVFHFGFFVVLRSELVKLESDWRFNQELTVMLSRRMSAARPSAMV